jgi:hypothetical protein
LCIPNFTIIQFCEQIRGAYSIMQFCERVLFLCDNKGMLVEGRICVSANPGMGKITPPYLTFANFDNQQILE